MSKMSSRRTTSKYGATLGFVLILVIRIADDKVHNAMAKAKAKSGEAGDGAKAAFSSVNE